MIHLAPNFHIFFDVSEERETLCKKGGKATAVRRRVDCAECLVLMDQGLEQDQLDSPGFFGVIYWKNKGKKRA